EVEIKDVVYSEFVGLLKVIQPGFYALDNRCDLEEFNFHDILDLAGRFKIEEARVQCILYLRHSPYIQPYDDYKLHIAKNYNLPLNLKPIETRNSFTAPTEFSNFVLIVEGKKLHANKEYLAAHSPIFATMFFGEFAGKRKEEVEIKDVVYEEFIDLLNVIHPGFTAITAASVTHILKLAHKYQMKEALAQSERFLIRTSKFEKEEKLIMADMYHLEVLSERTLNNIFCVFEMSDITRDNFSDQMAKKITERTWKLIDEYRDNHNNEDVCD
ncbi:hypothetical protein PMAYCL1PPCAC_25679, partial [Pristionchus mayeri]